MKNASGNEAWRPDDPSPEAEMAEGHPGPDHADGPLWPPTHPDGPIPGEYEQDTEWHNAPTMATGGVPSTTARGTGPDADPADEETRREGGGAPGER
jgi:hypothetical protein